MSSGTKSMSELIFAALVFLVTNIGARSPHRIAPSFHALAVAESQGVVTSSDGYKLTESGQQTLRVHWRSQHGHMYRTKAARAQHGGES